MLALVAILAYRESPGRKGMRSGLVLARQESALDSQVTRVALESLLERLDDSHRRIERAMENLESASRELQREREGIESSLDDRELKLDENLLQGLEDVGAVKAMAEANSAGLELIRGGAELPLQQRKQFLIHPVIQMRGNGTVGSAVLVYSESFAGEGPSAGYCNLALTAYHVVSEILGDRPDKNIEQVKLFSPDFSRSRQAFSARLIAFDKSMDIALLRLSCGRKISDLARLKTGNFLDQLDIFSPACAVGCPLGNSPIATMGQITAIDKEVEGESFWMINAPTYFGNSGGGVYSVPDCNLIGIFSMIYTYGKAKPRVVPHMGLFLPLASISRWLDTEGLGFVLDGGAVPSTAWSKMGYSPEAEPVIR